PDLAALVADGDEGVVGDVPDDVVAGVRHLRLVGDEDPRLREDMGLLPFMETGVGDDPGGEGAPLDPFPGVPQEGLDARARRDFGLQRSHSATTPMAPQYVRRVRRT